MAEKGEKKTKKKSNILFTLFACVATGFIVYMSMNLGDKAGKLVCPSNVSSNTEVNEKLTIADIKGSYKYRLESKSGDLAIKIDQIYTFYEDGTFKFVIVRPNSSGHVSYGNYYIEDDKIVVYKRLTYSEGLSTSADKEILTVKDKDTLLGKDVDNDEIRFIKEQTDESLAENKDYIDDLKNLVEDYNKI